MTYSIIRLLIFIILFLSLPVNVESEESLPDLIVSTADFTNSDIALSKALPREGDRVDIRVRVYNEGEKSLSDVVVLFFQENSQKEAIQLGREHVIENIRGNTYANITQKWLVPVNGFYKILLAVDPDNKINENNENNNKAYFEVPVLSKDLYFYYWSCPKSTKYVNSIMVSDEKEKEYWLGRGVIPAQGKTGYANINATEEEFITNWSSALKDGYPAIAIDEFGSDKDRIDRRMSSALIKTKEKCPNLKIFIWDAAGVYNKILAESYKSAADLVMLEQYRSSFREYYCFDSAWEAAKKAGITNKAVLGLGLYTGAKEFWITTEQELLRQVKYIKKLAPEMPGIAFFTNCPDHLYKSADKTVYDYFIKPVIWIKNVESNKAIIYNIGGMDGRDVLIEFFSGETGKGEQKLGLKKLDYLMAGQKEIVNIPIGVKRLFVVPQEHYTVLE